MRWLIPACGVRAAADPKSTESVPKIVGAHVRAHIEFLADDLMEGREAGTRGYDLAAHYVPTVLKSAGLKPAADDGTYFQKVPLSKEHVGLERALGDLEVGRCGDRDHDSC